AGQQYHIRHIVFAGVAATFKTIDRYGVAADALGFEGVAKARASVNDADSARFQRWHKLFPAAACGLDDGNSAFDDALDLFRVGRGRKSRKEGEVHTKGLVRHVAAA